MCGVRIQDDIPIAGRPALTAQTNSPMPLFGQLAIELAENGAGTRLKMAAGQRGADRRNLTAGGRIEEDAGAVLVEALVELQPVYANEPVQPMLAARPQARFQALGGTLAVLHVVVVIGIGGPQDGITPVAVEAVFDLGVGIGADDCQSCRPEARIGETQ